MNDYTVILKDGEKFWSQHTKLTLFELKDAINVIEISNRLPECMWEEIKHIHTTTYSTIWQLTSRWFEIKHPDTIGMDKPSQSFLKWIYEELKKVN